MSGRRVKHCHRSPRRTACSPFSATTTTITTCRAALAKCGIQGSSRRADAPDEFETEPLDLIGIRFWTRRPRTSRAPVARLERIRADPAGARSAAPHRRRPACRFRWCLSGHTHGDRSSLPVVGAVAAQKFPVVAGVGHREQSTIFVSRGIGTIYLPVRVNCPPEVACSRSRPA